MLAAEYLRQRAASARSRAKRAVSPIKRDWALAVAASFENMAADLDSASSPSPTRLANAS